MKRAAMALLFFINTGLSLVSSAQSDPEQELENLTAVTETENEDDQSLQELEQLRKNPVNLNEADEQELRKLLFLNELQIVSFIRYRRLTGKLLHLLELQSVPGWDLNLIRQLMPFVRVGAVMPVVAEAGHRFSHGEHQLLFRYGQALTRGEAYRKPVEENGYQGSPMQLLFRYTYRYKNNLQYGILGEKDAGESFFRRGQQAGFDFYSFHLFARRMGIIESLAIGDFSVNLGQGLIHWQSLAFKKSTAITAVKRQAAVLRPYHSAGEYNFHRGAGITIRKGRVASTLFFSLRKLSANVQQDTLQGEAYVSSVLSGGYHRNSSELEDRHTLSRFSAGGNLQYRFRQGHIGWNGIYYRYGLPLQKRPEPYNLYVWRGSAWANASIDYSYTWRNLHFFGEAALDPSGHTGLLNGLLLSVDPRVDLSLVQRKLPAAFQPVQGNAFTENTLPSNETGLYTGISIRPRADWKLDAYLDLYRFPWLRYRADAPGGGWEGVLQISYAPARDLLLVSRYRRETKTGNVADDMAAIQPTGPVDRESWRTQLNYTFNPQWVVRSRVELVWYNRGKAGSENGFMLFMDMIYKPLLKPWSGGIRLQYGETEGYNSRIYAYENDVLYSYAIPAFSGKGYRYYLNFQRDVGKRWSFWLKWAQTFFLKKKYSDGLETGAAAPAGSGFKIQLRYIFQ